MQLACLSTSLNNSFRIKQNASRETFRVTFVAKLNMVNKIISHPSSLSEKHGPLHWFTQKTCRFLARLMFRLRNSPKQLSRYEGKMFHPSGFSDNVSSYRRSIFPLDCFHQMDCCLIAGSFSHLKFFPDNLSPLQGTVFHLNIFRRQPVCFSGEIFRLEGFLKLPAAGTQEHCSIWSLLADSLSLF